MTNVMVEGGRRRATISRGVLFMLMVCLVPAATSQQAGADVGPLPHNVEAEVPVAPPMEPASWHTVPGTLLAEEDVWGKRVSPRATFDLPGGMLLVYQSRPRALSGDEESERRRTLMEQNIAPTEVGSLAFAEHLSEWGDYPDNPVLNQTPHDWQAGHRVHLQDVVYDRQRNRWVAYFGDRNGDYPGVRAVGVAYSRDLVNWDYVDRPIFTIDDYVDAAPEGRIEASAEALAERGRVYVAWSVYHDGRFYVTLNGTDRVGRERSDLSYSRVTFVADAPEGPYEVARELDRDDELPNSKPIRAAGRWYSVYTDTWDGQGGFGLVVADELIGPYERKHGEEPIVTVETTQNAAPLLFYHGGVWGVLFTGGGHWSDELPLRMAIADIHPSLLLRDWQAR